MPKILLVENDPSLRVLITWVLTDHIAGCTVHDAAHGRAFLALLEQLHPDLVLLDVHLTDTNGIDLYKLFRLRPDLREVPVLILTISPHLIQRADLAGPYTVLAKPFYNKDLIARVRSLLGAAAASEALDA